MLRFSGVGARRFVQAKFGYVSVAALLVLSESVRLAAQPGGTEPKQPPSPPSTEQRGSSETTTLPTVQVQRAKQKRPAQRKQVRTTPASAPAPQPTPTVASTETSPTGTNYQAGTPGVGRLTSSLVNTPQSVNVVTRQVITEQNSPSVRDALRNVAGITFRAGEGGNQGDTPYIRGFQSNNDIFRDGIRDPGWYTRDTFAIDAVEVYKGPASILFGRGSTGGVVNLISRTPLDRNFNEAQATVNTGPGVRGQIDTNHTFGDGGAWRIVTMGQLYDIAGRDHVEQNRWGVAPSIKFKVTDDTKVTLSYIHQHDDSVPDYGVPFLTPAWGLPRHPAPVPRNTWYGILQSPYPDTEKVDADILTGKIEHEFSKDLKVTNTTRYTNVDRLQRNVFPEQATIPPPPSLNANWTPARAQVAITNSLLANQTDVRANFWTGPYLEHTVATGLDLIRETRDFQRNAFAGMAATNFIAPNPWRLGGFPVAPTANQLLSGTSDNVGVFLADQIKFTKYFEVLGAIRYDQFRFVQDAPIADPTVQHLDHTDNIWSWRVGGVFHPWENHSLYVMRGTSFNPTADGLTISVATPATAAQIIGLGPEKTETTEVGYKAEVLNKKLTLASAVFHTEKTNLRVPDPLNNSFQVLDGIVRVLGFEASATGYLTDKWQVIASYSHINAKIKKTSVAAQIENEPQITPEHAFSLWSTYDVTPELQVGGGAFYTSSMWADLPNTAIVPGYWRFDAMAAYKLSKDATLQLNVYNLTNKFYYESAYTNWAVPGASRSAALTLRTRF
jgi:catecholate siderophore receptor